MDGSRVINAGGGGGVTPLSMQTPTFENSWADFGGVYQTARYWKDDYGVVHLEGLIANGTVNATMFTLPTGYRPSSEVIVLSSINGTAGRLFIKADGSVDHADGASNASVSLSGISFYAG
jgi:hypothetical protein